MFAYNASITKLREQTINARILPPADHAVLVRNIRKRGKLESVPYCVLTEKYIEIVSGHHRLRAASEAGLKNALVLLDIKPKTRSEIVAKQLAHNRLSGFDDPATLKKLFDMLDEPAHMLESGLANDLLEIPDTEIETGVLPNMNLEWQNIQLVFLPHQLDDFKELIAMIPATELVGAVPSSQFEAFAEALQKYSRIKEIRNIGTMVHHLTEIALWEIREAEDKKRLEEAENSDNDEQEEST